MPPAAPDRPIAPELRGLVVDWGGVLTQDLRSALTSWTQADDVDLEAWVATMREWFGEPFGAEARLNPIHALERGEMSTPDFEARISVELTRRSGREHPRSGLLQRLFTYFEHAADMVGLVRRAHESGLRTALLSNSWGNDYPRDGWDEMFDVVVISGEVGMRKPEPGIYVHTLELLGLQAGECVFVDDLAANVAAAVAVGMVGIRHESYAQTLAELEILFDRTLDWPMAT